MHTHHTLHVDFHISFNVRQDETKKEEEKKKRRRRRSEKVRRMGKKVRMNEICNIFSLMECLHDKVCDSRCTSLWLTLNALTKTKGYPNLINK